MSVISWFKVTHSPRSISCSWLLLMIKMENQIDSCLSWYTAEAKQRTNWLFKRSSYKKLIAECVFCRCCLSYKRILSDRRADCEEHNTQKTLSWLLLHPQSPIGRDLCANIMLFMITCFFSTELYSKYDYDRIRVSLCRQTTALSKCIRTTHDVHGHLDVFYVLLSYAGWCSIVLIICLYVLHNGPRGTTFQPVRRGMTINGIVRILHLALNMDVTEPAASS